MTDAGAGRTRDYVMQAVGGCAVMKAAGRGTVPGAAGGARGTKAAGRAAVRACRLPRSAARAAWAAASGRMRGAVPADNQSAVATRKEPR